MAWPGYSAGYGDAISGFVDTAFLVNSATNVSGLNNEILIQSLTATLSFIESGGNNLLDLISTEVVINEDGVSNVDFRVEGDTLTNLLFIDASQDNIGIGKAPTANYLLHVNQPASTSGSPTAMVVTGGAHTGLTSATTPDVDFALNRTVEFSSGNLDDITSVQIRGVTYAATAASTYTGVHTVWIHSAGTGANVSCASATPFLVGDNVTYSAHTAAFGYAAIYTPNHTVTLSGSTSPLTSEETIGACNFQQVTVTSTNAINIPDAATLFIEGPPIAGGSISFTPRGPYSIFVNAGICRFDGRMLFAKGADIASGNNITLGTDGNYFDITGTTQVNTISATNWIAGSIVVLQFDDIVTVAHNTAGTGASILLASSANFSATANDTLTLVYDGTTWREVARTAI